MAAIEVIESYRQRALDDLKAAEEMLSSKFYMAAVSLAYYVVFSARQTADYDAIPKIPQEVVPSLLEQAQEFVAALLTLK